MAAGDVDTGSEVEGIEDVAAPVVCSEADLAGGVPDAEEGGKDGEVDGGASVGGEKVGLVVAALAFPFWVEGNGNQGVDWLKGGEQGDEQIGEVLGTSSLLAVLEGDDGVTEPAVETRGGADGREGLRQGVAAIGDEAGGGAATGAPRGGETGEGGVAVGAEPGAAAFAGAVGAAGRVDRVEESARGEGAEAGSDAAESGEGSHGRQDSKWQEGEAGGHDTNGGGDPDRVRDRQCRRARKE